MLLSYFCNCSSINKEVKLVVWRSFVWHCKFSKGKSAGKTSELTSRRTFFRSRVFSCMTFVFFFGVSFCRRQPTSCPPPPSSVQCLSSLCSSRSQTPGQYQSHCQAVEFQHNHSTAGIQALDDCSIFISSFQHVYLKIWRVMLAFFLLHVISWSQGGKGTGGGGTRKWERRRGFRRGDAINTYADCGER